MLLGAGCTKTPVVNTDDQALAKITRDQQVYVYCTNRGYTATIRFDSEVNRNRIYCISEPGKECDAYDFMDGKCDPKKVKGEDVNASLTPIGGTRLNCDPIAKPVCAIDGKTYTNRCIAETQGKKVQYEGVCNEHDEPLVVEPRTIDPTPTKPTGSTGGTASGSTQPKTTTPEPSHGDSTPESASAPEWIPNLTSVLQSSASPYKITLSECTEGKNKYYYQKEDCSSCFKILYKESGETACYPGMDDGQCPTWSEKNCKVIWEK